jgi:WD40 repeat protein
LLVSASYDETIVLWSVATGEYLKTFVGHQGPVLSAKFCNEDRFSTGEAPPTIVSVGVDRTVKIWDIQTGECLNTLTGHNGLIYTLDIGNLDSTKSIAFTGSLDETIKVWDLEAAKCLATWKSLRPYEGMQIDRIRGLTKAQQASLYALGAVRD